MVYHDRKLGLLLGLLSWILFVFFGVLLCGDNGADFILLLAIAPGGLGLLLWMGIGLGLGPLKSSWLKKMSTVLLIVHYVSVYYQLNVWEDHSVIGALKQSMNRFPVWTSALFSFYVFLNVLCWRKILSRGSLSP